MELTRRAFFMHPTRVVGEDLENAGEWLRRAGQQKGCLPLRSGGAAAAEQADPVTARGIGLRNARANMRRNGHE